MKERKIEHMIRRRTELDQSFSSPISHLSGPGCKALRKVKRKIKGDSEGEKKKKTIHEYDKKTKLVF